MANSLSERDLILLNAYLDGALSAAEREALERRLSTDPSLRRELEALRATIALLRMAERVPVPRSFTLDPAVYGRPVRSGLFDLLSAGVLRPVAAGVALLLSLLMFAGAFLTSAGLGGVMAPMAAEAPQAEPMLEAAGAAEENAMADEAALASEAPPEPEIGALEAAPQGTLEPTAAAELAEPAAMAPAPAEEEAAAEEAPQPLPSPDQRAVPEEYAADEGTPPQEAVATKLPGEEPALQPARMSVRTLTTIGLGILGLGFAVLAVGLLLRRR